MTISSIEPVHILLTALAVFSILAFSGIADNIRKHFEIIQTDFNEFTVFESALFGIFTFSNPKTFPSLDEAELYIDEAIRLFHESKNKLKTPFTFKEVSIKVVKA